MYIFLKCVIHELGGGVGWGGAGLAPTCQQQCTPRPIDYESYHPPIS